MYTSIDDARTALDEVFSPATVTTVLAARVPAIGFALAGKIIAYIESYCGLGDSRRLPGES